MSKYPHNWQLVAVQDIAGVIRGASPRPKSDPRYYGGTVPRLMGADVTRDGKYVTPQIDFLTEEGAKLSRPMPAGTLTIVCSGLVGVPAILAVDACIHDGFLALENISSEVDIEYLYYTFWQIRENLEASATHGGVFINLTTSILKEFEIPLPPLPEQRKIAAILSMWDEAITLTEQLIAALQRRKQALMQVLLTGQVRFREFEGERWEEVELGEIVTPITRNEAVEPDKEYSLIGVRWYLAGAHIHEVRLGSDIVIDLLSRIEKEDILYNKMWVTKAAFGVAKEEHHNTYGTSEYPQFRAKQQRLDVNYLEYAFHDPLFQYEATSLCRGTTGRARLNPRDFLRIKIDLPPLEEQTNIAYLLRSADEEINTYTQYLERLTDLKRGLMQQLLTGAVRVQVEG